MSIQTVTPMECSRCGKDNWEFQTRQVFHKIILSQTFGIN